MQARRVRIGVIGVTAARRVGQRGLRSRNRRAPTRQEKQLPAVNMKAALTSVQLRRQQQRQQRQLRRRPQRPRHPQRQIQVNTICFTRL